MCDLILVKLAPIVTKIELVLGSLPAVTLTFDLWKPKSNQHIYEPKYICVRSGVKFPSLVFEIRC